ncbi:mannosyltransferase putative-domain-containing protein [Protomyces lactucae-debilis]|uniref:Mannosyltransferase putative-domain-containing protein n=1 Tax=Protomyces lactucae-debilis TaxID=2754530 RepID=A0A1Y2FAR5_PROLT|nr:mannosyltransferase putative-domain-containing protein [Protomyces lactucae-debilis]ORY80436.1 mannosyltransferase putative-domain-containing protein [Protomyces lactucae-debilis]
MRLIIRLVSALGIVGCLTLLYLHAQRIASGSLPSLASSLFGVSDNGQPEPYVYPHRETIGIEKVDIKHVAVPSDDPKVLKAGLTAEETIEKKISGGVTAVLHPQKEEGAQDTVYQELRVALDAADRLEKAPILSFEKSLQLNKETCPLQGYNYDRANLKGNYKQWSALSDKDIATFRHKLIMGLREIGIQSDKMPQALIELRLTESERKDKLLGRGIVFSAGDGNALRRVLLNVKLLREHGCTLPVEVFSWAWEADALPAEVIAELTQLNVRLQVASGGLEKADGWKDFRIKPLAILQSSFEHVLWLDSDSFTLRDPSYLFDSAIFRDSGLLLWPDFTKSQPRNPIWRIIGQPCRPEHEGESGQIVIDKHMHRATLQLATWFATTQSEDQKLWYSHFGGDRDSFRISAVILGSPFKGPRRLLSIAGQQVQSQPLAKTALPDEKDENGKPIPEDVREAFLIESRVRGLHAAGHTMLQYDMDGQALFVHANLIKHGALPRDQRIWSVVTRLRNDRIPGGSYGSFAQEAPSTTTETFDETVARGGWKSDEERHQEQEALFGQAFANKIAPPEKRDAPMDIQTTDVQFGRGVIIHVAQSPLSTMMLDLAKVLNTGEAVQVGTEKPDGSSPFVIEPVKPGDDLWRFEDLYLKLGGTT